MSSKKTKTFEHLQADVVRGCNVARELGIATPDPIIKALSQLREECAKIAENMTINGNWRAWDDAEHGYEMAKAHIAKAIRENDQ